MSLQNQNSNGFLDAHDVKTLYQTVHAETTALAREVVTAVSQLNEVKKDYDDLKKGVSNTYLKTFFLRYSRWIFFVIIAICILVISRSKDNFNFEGWGVKISWQRSLSVEMDSKNGESHTSPGLSIQ